MRFEFNDDSQKICNSVDVVNYGIQCDICGNKVLSVSNINGKRYCAGCYYKTFMKDNQKAEIDQLKQQLEESFTEEDVEGLIEDRNKTIKFLQKELADKQNTIDEINKEFVQAVHDWKALCAKKDNEIERLKVFEKAYYFNQLQASQEDIQQFQQLANQSAAVNINHIAITELEKVKELVKDKSAWSSPFGLLKIQESDVEQIIDQQIKELKGEKDVED